MGTPRNIQPELEFQSKRAAALTEVLPTPDYVVDRYRQCRLWRFFGKEFVFRSLPDLRGSALLDFGCGEGVITTQLALLGAQVTGIDISPELVAVARERARLDAVEERVNLLSGDLRKISGLWERFDVVLCYKVLHHVDLEEYLDVILACLKRGGVFIAFEPIAYSAALQKLRDIVPISKNASPDERQLNQDEIRDLLSRLHESKVRYFCLFSRLRRFCCLMPTRSIGGIHSPSCCWSCWGGSTA